MESIWVALSLGFLGSFHCVGMCGPIALALPLNRNSILSKVNGALFYNLGRVFTYALLGGFFGLIGQSFAIAGYQQNVSIILGIAILMMVVLPNSLFAKYKLINFISRYTNQLKAQLGKLFKKSSNSSLFFIGTLNGLLPCGLVYLGVAGAIATGDNLKGSLFMAVFGLGTLPAMLSLALLGNSISVTIRQKINKAVPVFVVTMGLLLILRGLNLGIPYVSPKISESNDKIEQCCHKK